MAGAIVGGVFWAYAAHRVHVRHRDNVSGLVHISHRYFDKDPVVNSRWGLPDLLRFDEGGGADGQFFYLITFDPFLSAFRSEPTRYAEFIDAPPYRYGRIGFPLLTRLFALNQPLRYPVTMVALVIGALALSGFLLARIAQHHGLSAWVGLLIVAVPGFWQSVESAMPEPIAIAFLLGAYYCVSRQRYAWAGVLLGSAMLVRETGGVLALALIATIALGGRRREAIVVAALGFVPIMVWKAFVGWHFWPSYGMASVFFTPNNAGLPFSGVAEMLTRIRAGVYFDGNPDAVRAGISCAILTTAAAAIGVASAIRTAAPVAIAAALYGLLAATYNYDGVWLHMSQVQRLTVDLFVALALVFTQVSNHRILQRVFVVFWIAAAWHVLFGALESGEARESLLAWWR